MRTAFFFILTIVALSATPQASAQDCSEEVVFETSPGALVMRQSEARFNCCAWLDVEVVQDGYEIGVFEWERFDSGPCYCLCCFAIEASVSGLDPGDYSVSVWKLYDNFDGTWTHELVGTWTVGVTGTSDPAVTASYVPCAQSAIPGETTWGVIKALYRREVRQ